MRWLKGAFVRVSSIVAEDLERLRSELYVIAENEKDFTGDRLVAASRVFELAAMLFIKPQSTRKER